MTTRKVGFLLFGGGVAAFLFALLGEFGPGSIVHAASYLIVVGWLGPVVILGGVLALLASLRGEAFCPPHFVVVLVAALALALHLYEALQNRSGDFPLGMLLWSIFPYSACLVISSVQATRTAAIGGAVAALCLDLLAHYEAFINPKHSAVALGLLFVPLWNLLIFVPVTSYVVWLLARRKVR